MANKYIQKCSTSVAIKGNANQNDNEILSYPSYNGKKTKNAGEDVGEKYPLYTVGGNVNWCSCYGNQYGDSQKKPKNKIAL
jgi:hypothetical protein